MVPARRERGLQLAPWQEKGEADRKGQKSSTAAGARIDESYPRGFSKSRKARGFAASAEAPSQCTVAHRTSPYSDAVLDLTTRAKTELRMFLDVEPLVDDLSEHLYPVVW